MVIPDPFITTPREGIQVLVGDREDSFATFLRTGVEYARRPTRRLQMSILSPLRANEDNSRGLRNPLLVFVQGGGFNEQDMSVNIPLLVEFAHQGFVVASVQHRPADEAPFPGQIDDLRLALRFLEDNAHSIGANADRIGLCGASSGGHTVVMLAVTAHLSSLGGDALSSHSCDIKAVVDFFGPVDFIRLEENLPGDRESRFATGRRNLLGGLANEQPERARLANPITYIAPERPLPPFLIIHGDEDDVVPYEQSLLLYDALISAGQRVSFIKVSGGGHARNIFTREVLRRAGAFLHNHL